MHRVYILCVYISIGLCRPYVSAQTEIVPTSYPPLAPEAPHSFTPVDLGYNHAGWPTGKILVQFTDGIPSAELLRQISDNFQLEIFHEPSVELPSEGRWTYIFGPLGSSGNYDPLVTAEMIENAFPGQIMEAEADLLCLVPGNCLQISEMYLSPNQPNKLWHIYNAAETVWNNQDGTFDADADVCECWSQGYTGQGIKVGVIDFDGFEFTHPDLQGQLLSGWNCIINAPLTNTYISSSGSSHGMATAGIIGAKANNNTGTVGVAYNARILPYLVSGTIGEAIIGLQKSITDGADVINMSFYTPYNSPSLHNEITNCATLSRPDGYGGYKGCVMVAATGNENHSSSARYPAAWDEVIGVGASNPDDYRAHEGDSWGSWNNGGSNFGPYYDVVAPGSVIYTLDLSGGNGFTTGDYISLNGTSFAAPIVSGIVALILEKNPGLTRSEVETVLKNNAIKTRQGEYNYNAYQGDPGRSEEMQYGRVSCINTLQEVPLDAGEYTAAQDVEIYWLNEDALQVNTILTGEPSQKINIWNMQGQLIITENTLGNSTTISTFGLTQGIYLLTITDENQTAASYKFIKH